ncbi:MAG: hypothetical protein ACJAUG_003192 [Halioglobus sp.]|jgi:hypothetical protein
MTAMPSFEEQFYIENPSRWQALRRDLRLLLWLAHKAWLWLGKGLLVRIAYRRARRSKKTLILEDQFKS